MTYTIHMHKGLISSNDGYGEMCNTRIETVNGIETLRRATAIAATYEANGYSCWIPEPDAGFLDMLRDARGR